MGELQVEISGGVGWIYIDNEEKRNAINIKIMNTFPKLLEQLKNDDQVKVIVITGKGTKTFCSGGDLSVFHKLHTEKEAYSMLSNMSETLMTIFTYPKPTIALLNGITIGGGCEIAIACDLRVALPNTKLGFVQARLGITTGWGGSTYLFEKLSKDNALYLLASGTLFSAQEAKQIGFIQEVLSEENFEQEFLSWINPIIEKPLPVLRAYKTRLLDTYDMNRLQHQVNREIRECAILWESEEHHQRVKQFIEKK
jgi:enoyl-CoA hydratase